MAKRGGGGMKEGSIWPRRAVDVHTPLLSLKKKGGEKQDRGKKKKGKGRCKEVMTSSQRFARV